MKTCPSTPPATVEEMIGQHEPKTPTVAPDGVRVACRRCGVVLHVPNPPRTGFRVERIVPAEDVDAVAGRRRHILASHVAQMAAEVSDSLKEKRISARPYRIRISVEPEEES